ncbi:MAG: phytanoyl-CoA dioxygenase family protein [Deltaproteobacteria bacterium]|nr:phytanoyl-CoA dioxygenase family protein [Deltaproteobacteria bacterium]
MEKPALEFVESPYSTSEVEELTRQFRERGWVILPDVLKRETVDPFVRQLESLMVHVGHKYSIPDDSPHYLHAVFAPRGRQVLPSSLSHSVAKPLPSLHTTILVIQTKGDASDIPEWHKDREPDGMAGAEYHYPLDVFLAYYFEDMTDDHGPTLVIPGSHRDVRMTPQTPGVPVDTIYCRKQDALLIDQRTWHRGTPRKVPGTRFLFVYGLCAIPHFYGPTFHMPRSQRRAWMNASSTRERVFLGGPFAPPDQDTLKLMQEELETEGRPVVTFPRQT